MGHIKGQYGHVKGQYGHVKGQYGHVKGQYGHVKYNFQKRKIRMRFLVTGNKNNYEYNVI